MTNAEARFNIALRPRKPEGSLGRTAQDVHLDSHTAPELWTRNEHDTAFAISAKTRGWPAYVGSYPSLLVKPTRHMLSGSRLPFHPSGVIMSDKGRSTTGCGCLTRKLDAVSSSNKNTNQRKFLCCFLTRKFDAVSNNVRPSSKKSANKRKCLCCVHTRKLNAVSYILQGPRLIKTPINENFLQGSSMRLVCQIKTLIDGHFCVVSYKEVRCG